MQGLVQKLFSNESPSDSEMLILWFLSIYTDISTQGSIDFPCWQKKRSVFTEVMLPSAMLWSGDQMVFFFSEMLERLLPAAGVCCFPSVTIISSDFNLQNPTFICLAILCPVSSPCPCLGRAERRMGAAGRRSPAPRCDFLLLERGCSLRAG